MEPCGRDPVYFPSPSRLPDAGLRQRWRGEGRCEVSENRERKQSMLWLAGSVAALVTVLLPLAGWWLTNPRLQRATLPDGSILILDPDIAAGGPHRQPLALFQRLRPASLLQRRRPWHLLWDPFPYWASVEAGGLGFWLSRSGQGSQGSLVLRLTAAAPGTPPVQLPQRVYLSNPGDWAPFASRVHPRRSRWVNLQVHRLTDPDGTPPLAVFSVPNPSPGPHPVWTAPPLPQTITQGPLAVTLSRVRTTPWARTLQEYELDLGVRERGTETEAWLPVRVGLADATGNRYTGDWHPLQRQRTRRTTFRAIEPVPGEVLGLELFLAPVRLADVPASRIWRKVRIAVPLVHTTLNLTKSVGGGTIRIQSIHSIPRGQRPRKLIRIVCDGETPGDRTPGLYRVTDDRGRSVLSRTKILSFNSAPQIEVARNTRWVELTLGVPQFRSFRFRIRPDDLQ
ncbi:MAG: hypothetical protein FJX77_06390 [Armatimonadetes bacterium]|nr:hypothetical protein [Armatimonadota bacterium]